MDPLVRKMLDDDPFEQPETTARIKASFDDRVQADAIKAVMEVMGRPSKGIGEKALDAVAIQRLETVRWEASWGSLAAMMADDVPAVTVRAVPQEAARADQYDLPLPQFRTPSRSATRHDGD